MEIPTFVIWIVLSGIITATIASILSYKYLRPKPNEKKRKIFIILAITIIVIEFAIIVFDHFL